METVANGTQNQSLGSKTKSKFDIMETKDK